MPNRVDNQLGELGRSIFLKEVVSVGDCGVCLALGARDVFEKRFCAALGDRIAIAETAHERFGPGGQHLPSGTIVCSGRILWRCWHERWKDPGPCLKGLIWKRSVVCRDLIRCCR